MRHAPLRDTASPFNNLSLELLARTPDFADAYVVVRPERDVHFTQDVHSSEPCLCTSDGSRWDTRPARRFYERPDIPVSVANISP